RAPRRPEFQFVTLAHTAGGVEQLAQGDAERRLVLTGLRDVARERENLESWRLLGAHLPEPGGATAHDRRHARDGLDVVDDGRACVETLDRGERRAQPRLATEALQRFEQRGLFTA